MNIVITILQVIGLLIGLFAVYLIVVALVPGLSVPRQDLKTARKPAGEEDAKPSPSRKDVNFEIKGTPVSAWLYLPENLSALVPCIVMGNGTGGTKDMGMEHYALRYQEAGFAVLTFDYRHFGESGGEPRQLIWIPYQLQDYLAAVEYARGLPEINPKRIAIWGTSGSGGHVIVVAAKDHRITCAVAQCPGLEKKASKMPA
jgi:cephalosporin-C deacetylase-like acetyl esterase